MYRYDPQGKLVHSYVYDSATMLDKSNIRLWYDEESRLAEISYGYGYTYTYGTVLGADKYNYYYDTETGELSSMTFSDGTVVGTFAPTYDRFGRISQRNVDFEDADDGMSIFDLSQSYDFKTNGNKESILVSQMNNTVTADGGDYTVSTAYGYEYDKNGNITVIRQNGTVYNKYYYDDLDQLIREDNREKNATYVYTYDNAGNITSKKTYAFTIGALGSATNTVTYTYGNATWGDLLTSYGGAPISYDAIGNPTSIDLDSLTWQGRELQSYNDGEYEISFKYNADGIRTVKDVCELAPGVTIRHSYTLSGSQILSETVYHCFSATMVYEQYMLVYIYDESGAPIGIKYRKPSYAPNDFDYYFFEKNLQGDIIAIYNESGTKIGTYTYDAWGNCTTSYTSGYNFILNYNPFRYRGYYYDTETGYYYLQSRYYNPAWGRFINADGYVSTGQGFVGYNMFAYCNNSPIMYIDVCGDIPIHFSVIFFPIALAKRGIEFYQGWKYRIDPPDPDIKVKRHIHIWKGGNKYSQNEDGTPHDKGGQPPTKEINILKNKGIWEWKPNPEDEPKKKSISDSDLIYSSLEQDQEMIAQAMIATHTVFFLFCFGYGGESVAVAGATLIPIAP